MYKYMKLLIVHKIEDGKEFCGAHILSSRKHSTIIVIIMNSWNCETLRFKAYFE